MLSKPMSTKSPRTRKAILPDAEQIHELISAYSGDGTLLPRTLAEICENMRDFVVLEGDGRIIGCGALHLYGTHLAEIRSITVAQAGFFCDLGIFGRAARRYSRQDI